MFFFPGRGVASPFVTNLTINKGYLSRPEPPFLARAENFFLFLVLLLLLLLLLVLLKCKICYFNLDCNLFVFVSRSMSRGSITRMGRRTKSSRRTRRTTMTRTRSSRRQGLEGGGRGEFGGRDGGGQGVVEGLG